MSTARRNWISAVALETIVEKVVESMETRMVRKRVLPRNAKVTIRMGPRSQWNCADVVMPVPSSPNHIQSIHLETVIGS